VTTPAGRPAIQTGEPAPSPFTSEKTPTMVKLSANMSRMSSRRTMKAATAARPRISSTPVTPRRPWRRPVTMLIYRARRRWRMETRMLTVGHIEYSNCIPVHALLLEGDAPPGIELRSGVPTALNAELRAGRIHVAPSSSIEYARNADRYRLLGFAIGARGDVQSVLLETTRPMEELDGAEVAVPTASATSVVLLRALCEIRHGGRPRYREFVQTDDADPIGDGAAAALWIGDIALRRIRRTRHPLLDMGGLFTEWTGLPFVFALWQTSAGPELDDELLALAETLEASRRYYE